MRGLVRLAVFAAAGYGVYWFLKNSRFFEEQPVYFVEREEDGCEIRRYPELTVATVPMASADSEGNEAFMKLFRFIQGGNNRGQEIAMTVPVILDGEPDALKTMSFIVPKAVAARGVPTPIAGDIQITQRPGGRFAAIRFGGWTGIEGEAEALRRLRAWTSRIEAEVSGEPLIAYYDAPWTPGFLKRNEVLLPLKD